MGSAAATTAMFHLVHREPIEGRWVVNATAPGAEVKWGVCERNWIDATVPYVRVNPCDGAGGTNPTTEIVNVKLPVTLNHDPNLVTDDVVAYAITTSGEYVCASAYQDAAFGTIQMQQSTAAPAGWEYLTNMKDRMPIGAGADFTIGGSGGSTSHNHDQVGTDGGGTAASQFTDRSNMPPYRIVGFIVRLDNSTVAP